MRNVVEESRMRKTGMTRRWGEDEMVRSDCPIISMMVDGDDDDDMEGDDMQHEAIMSGMSSSNETSSP
jgi:hypothetical protein